MRLGDGGGVVEEGLERGGPGGELFFDKGQELEVIKTGEGLPKLGAENLREDVIPGRGRELVNPSRLDPRQVAGGENDPAGLESGGLGVSQGRGQAAEGPQAGKDVGDRGEI